MATALTVNQVLEKGIQREIESQLLYIGLSQKVKEPAAKNAFKELAHQEREHQERLEQYRRGELKGGALSGTEVVNYKIAEKLGHVKKSTNMSLKDTFLLAANREKASHEFYVALAKIHPEGEVKDLLKELAAQELKHKQTVELLYTEVAFPQTDGG